MKRLFTVSGLLLSLIGCAERIPLETPRTPENYPEIVRLTAQPMIVHTGEAVVLRWDARNASEVMLEQACDPKADIRAKFESLGTFPPSGTIEVHPKGSTTFVVSCGNAVIGCSSASVHVIVK